MYKQLRRFSINIRRLTANFRKLIVNIRNKRITNAITISIFAHMRAKCLTYNTLPPSPQLPDNHVVTGHILRILFFIRILYADLSIGIFEDCCSGNRFIILNNILKKQVMSNLFGLICPNKLEAYLRTSRSYASVHHGAMPPYITELCLRTPRSYASVHHGAMPPYTPEIYLRTPRRFISGHHGDLSPDIAEICLRTSRRFASGHR